MDEEELHPGRKSIRLQPHDPMKWWGEENSEAKSTKLNTEVKGAQHAAPLRGRPWS
jgi:hypothetical protein